VELIVRSGTTRDLLTQLEAHAIEVVLATSAAPLFLSDQKAQYR